MGKCVACGAKSKEQRIGMDYCKICAINFDNRMQLLDNSDDVESFKKNLSKVLNAINTKDKYTDENKEKVISYIKSKYDAFVNKENEKKAKGLIFSLHGSRGRHMEVYENKVVITNKITIGSVAAGNVTDGKKIIYYSDVIGIQLKKAGVLMGYLQLETASSLMNNEKDNFYNENTFTFSQGNTSNEKIEKVFNYLSQRLEQIKFPRSEADEIRKYKELLDDNIITLEEFESKKKQLLNL